MLIAAAFLPHLHLHLPAKHYSRSYCEAYVSNHYPSASTWTRGEYAGECMTLKVSPNGPEGSR